MLNIGFKAGQIPDHNFLNLMAKTAEQIANVNICSKIKALDDASGTDLSQYVYHTQIRDDFILIAVYVSNLSLSSPIYPVLDEVLDRNGNDITSHYSIASSSSTEFDFTKNEETYKVTFLQKNYDVATAGKVRARFKIRGIGGTVKSYENTFINSLFVMQSESGIGAASIPLISEGEMSDFSWFNTIKSAFRKNMSYNTCIGFNGEILYNQTLLNNIKVINDLYELGNLNFISSCDNSNNCIRLMMESSLTSGTLFDYQNFAQTEENINKILAWPLNLKASNPLYYTTGNTFNLAIDSISGDALNSYDLVMLANDLYDRLQGKLYYPTIGENVIANTAVPIIAEIIFNNNIDNLDFNRELSLASNYKLKFAII